VAAALEEIWSSSIIPSTPAASDPRTVKNTAISGVGINSERDFHAGGDIAGAGDIRLVTKDSDIGSAERQFIQSGAGNAAGFEPHLLDQAGAETIVNAGLDQDFLGFDQTPELRVFFMVGISWDFLDGSSILLSGPT
jgi:hypothetical protein